MQILPSEKLIPRGADVKTISYPSTTWLVDPKTGRCDATADGIEVMEQAVEIHLSVERFRYVIFTPNFGNELKTLLGKRRDYVKAQIIRMVEDALSVDDRINGVDGFTFEDGEDSVTAFFNVHTIYGDLNRQIVVAGE